MRSSRRQGKGGQSKNAAGSNASTNNGGGGNAPANRAAPAKSADGTLLCLMELGDVTYSTNTDGKAQSYLDTGAPSHFINEIEALHDYVPFEAPE